MSNETELNGAPLSARLRAGIEAAPWVIEEVKRLEAMLGGKVDDAMVERALSAPCRVQGRTVEEYIDNRYWSPGTWHAGKRDVVRAALLRGARVRVPTYEEWDEMLGRHVQVISECYLKDRGPDEGDRQRAYDAAMTVLKADSMDQTPAIAHTMDVLKRILQAANMRTDGDLMQLLERAEHLSREDRCLIASQRALLEEADARGEKK